MMGRALQLPRATHTVGIAVDQELQHRRRFELGRTDPIGVRMEAKIQEIQLIHERVVSPDRIGWADVLFYARWQKEALFSFAGDVGHASF
jgi:hypothetical protein